MRPVLGAGFDTATFQNHHVRSEEPQRGGTVTSGQRGMIAVDDLRDGGGIYATRADLALRQHESRAQDSASTKQHRCREENDARQA